MLKTRVMPTLLCRGGALVKGTGFDAWRTVGGIIQSIRVFSLREVDELVFLDIEATAEGRPPNFEQVADIADACQMPLAVGGGITSLQHIHDLLAAGADKIVLGSAAHRDPTLVTCAAERFGAQCVVVAIDSRRQGDRHEVHTGCGRIPTGRDPADFAAEMERLGAGEIIVTSIDRDGTLAGYDLDLVARVAKAAAIPVIASGGAGHPDHFVAAVQAGAAAVAAGAIFHFTEHTPLAIKRRLVESDIPARIPERSP